MRVAVVVTLLLGAVICASAGSVETSFPKPATGRLTCILPVKQLRCVVDTRTGFVAGMRYGYGAIGEMSVCQGSPNSYQTGWDMSPVGYRQRIDCPANSPVNPFQPATFQGARPNWPGTPTTPIDEAYLMPYGSMISQVLVLAAPNPLGEEFGDIAAIAFRYTNQDLINAAAALNPDNTPTCPREPYSWAVCGNLQYAQAYLYPGASPTLPPTGPVVLKATYTSPLTDGSDPSFLGSFQGLCDLRGGGYLGGDPHKSSKFHVKELKKVCFTRMRQVIPATPFAYIQRPDVPNPNAPFTPCFWDKKNSKDSPSVSCVRTGAVVATGKFGVIQVDGNGQPWDWTQTQSGNFAKVEASSVFLGTQPDTEFLSEESAMAGDSTEVEATQPAESTQPESQ